MNLNLLKYYYMKKEINQYDLHLSISLNIFSELRDSLKKKTEEDKEPLFQDAHAIAKTHPIMVNYRNSIIDNQLKKLNEHLNIVAQELGEVQKTKILDILSGIETLEEISSNFKRPKREIISLLQIDQKLLDGNFHIEFINNKITPRLYAMRNWSNGLKKEYPNEDLYKLMKETEIDLYGQKYEFFQYLLDKSGQDMALFVRFDETCLNWIKKEISFNRHVYDNIENLRFKNISYEDSIKDIDESLVEELKGFFPEINRLSDASIQEYHKKYTYLTEEKIKSRDENFLIYIHLLFFGRDYESREDQWWKEIDIIREQLKI